MTEKQQENLIKQIFASEVDYLEIKQRADVLRGKGNLTDAEQFTLNDYDKKLRHDEEVIASWVKMLSDDGIKDLSKFKTLRDSVLDEIKIRAQNDELTGTDGLNNQVNDLEDKKKYSDKLSAVLAFNETIQEDNIYIDPSINKDNLITDEDYNFKKSDLEKRKIRLENKLANIENLKGMNKNIWQQ